MNIYRRPKPKQQGLKQAASAAGRQIHSLGTPNRICLPKRWVSGPHRWVACLANSCVLLRCIRAIVLAKARVKAGGRWAQPFLPRGMFRLPWTQTMCTWNTTEMQLPPYLLIRTWSDATRFHTGHACDIHLMISFYYHYFIYLQTWTPDRRLKTTRKILPVHKLPSTDLKILGGKKNSRKGLPDIALLLGYTKLKYPRSEWAKLLLILKSITLLALKHQQGASQAIRLSSPTVSHRPLRSPGTEANFGTQYSYDPYNHLSLWDGTT